MKRKGLISVLAVSALGLATVGVASLQSVSVADAQDQAVSQIAWMEDGGSVRFGNAGNGLRFTMQIRADAFDASATYGILIAPEDGYTLTEENVFGAGAIYNWAEKDENGNWKEYVPEEGKTQIVNLVTKAFNDDTVEIDGEKVAVKEFYGSLVNLDESNFAREFRAVGYIRTGTEGNYDYTLVGDSDNVRSMAYVAQLAIEDTSDKAPTQTQKEDLQKTYLDKVANVASSYTQEYYLEQADGSYAKADDLTETLSEYNGETTKIGTSVSFVGREIAGYEQVEGEGVLSGKVYANGYLVLKAYYNRIAIETIQGESKLQAVDSNYDLVNLLTEEEAETFAQYSALGEVAWKLNDTALESSVVDFSTTAKQVYTVTANIGEEVAYTAEIDFYNENETVWSFGVNADDLVIKLDKASVTKSVATDPAGKTGDFYQITTENAQYHAFVKPVHTQAYYARMQGKGLVLNLSVYVDATTSTDTLMAFATNSIVHVMGSKWYDITISLDDILANWDNIFNASRTSDWKDAILMTRDSTSTTFYVSAMTFSVQSSVEVVTETTARLIDMNGVNSYDMNNVLSLAGVAESVYADKDIIWELTPVYGGEKVTVVNEATLTTVEKRAYNATANVSVYGLLAPIYTGVVDFYDSTEAVVWNNDISLSDFIYKTTSTGKKSTPTTSLVTDAPDRTGEYLKIQTNDMIVLLPQHSKMYYNTIGGESVLKFDIHMATEDTTNKEYKVIYWANKNGDFKATNGEQRKLNTWYTLSISVSLLVEYWDYVVLTYGTDTGAEFNGTYSYQCGMVSAIGYTDATTGAVTRTGYIGNFRIE